MYCGATGAILGTGIGNIVRNTGGAVTVAFFVLIIAPGLVVQLVSETASWMPTTLAGVLSGVTSEVSAVAAVVALALWAVVPAVFGLVAVVRRDVV